MTASGVTYDERKRTGLCVRCGEVKPPPGMATCRQCADAVNARRVSTAGVAVPVRSSGVYNVCCQAHGFHRSDCKEPPAKKATVR